MIIPMELHGGPHVTRFCDLHIDEKVNWDGQGHFLRKDKSRVEYDRQLLESYSDFEWSVGNVIFFNSRQIHKAIFPESSNCYKRSINGLGYRIVDSEDDRKHYSPGV